MNCNLAFDPCPERESGGVQCEEPFGHETDLFATPHSVSDHTIMHNIWGSGHSCSNVDTWLAEMKEIEAAHKRGERLDETFRRPIKYVVVGF